ncbi:OsmC family protein [Pseudomonas promysalinigenes]|uniref:OsmC family protein n=1 Tax=Pseudomonas promysalinigenes TaxID=485898 RepID=A0ABY6AK07_9PSED|nr:OsmC family protein [Pseudomonas promysalinigenes]UXH39335.1 OsmC family protein [Pseudomonas promysalinigenes]
MKEHTYQVTVDWVGNTGEGTSSYTSYQRNFIAQALSKPVLEGSADPAFRGDASRWNPEDMLVASLSACHKLWYLHLCAVNAVNVLEYVDNAQGRMVEGDAHRKGHFTEVVLRPQIVVSAESDVTLARQLHDTAHHECFLANSVNFPVRCEPAIHRQG